MYIDAGCSLTSCCNEFMSADNRHNYYGNYTHTHTHKHSEENRFVGFFFLRVLALGLLAQAFSTQPGCRGCWQDGAHLLGQWPEDITGGLPQAAGCAAGGTTASRPSALWQKHES